MNETIELSELPKEIQDQIHAERAKAEELSKVPVKVAHREFEAAFSTKEIRELSAKVDELITQYNNLFDVVMKKK